MLEDAAGFPEDALASLLVMQLDGVIQLILLLLEVSD